MDSQSSIFIPVPLYRRSCLRFSAMYSEAKTHNITESMHAKKEKFSQWTQTRISRDTKTPLFSVSPDRAKTDLII